MTLKKSPESFINNAKKISRLPKHFFPFLNKISLVNFWLSLFLSFFLPPSLFLVQSPYILCNLNAIFPKHNNLFADNKKPSRDLYCITLYEIQTNYYIHLIPFMTKTFECLVGNSSISNFVQGPVTSK